MHIILVFLLLGIFSLGAQTDDPVFNPEQRVLDMDIRTSAFSELAAWCRSLGLSEGGTKEELANRLRTYYNLPPPQGNLETTEKQRIVIIESARSTEYFTLDVVDEEYARLRGGVVISLKDGEALHRIRAEEILYNRTRNVMTASGGVEYVKESGDSVETFKGESITVNLDNWSSIFLDGISERAMNTDANAYRFSGTIISRSDAEVTVLSKAVVSNAKNEEAYWSLSAYKLWLLPGSDWAVLSAVLKVGEIPVFYFPFFHFAADERIFHPALGYRSRVGNFVQTTTYLLGRSLSSGSAESSLSKIMGDSGDMEKVREGIFLRSTGKKSRDPNDKRLAILFDAYSNLGTYLGTELILPKKGIFGATELSSGIGFTRDVYQVNSAYTPFAQYESSDNWNTSRFFSMDAPFRYRFNTKGSLGGAYGSLNWTFPFYADPYVNRDFLNRSEEMDWVKLFKREDEEDDTTKNVLGSYEWRINASLTPTISSLKPYITTLTVSNISSAVHFNTRRSTRITNGVSPNRNFYFPDMFTIYSISASAAGTPFTWGNQKTPPAPAGENPPKDPFQGAGTPRSPWETPEPPEKTQGSAAGLAQLNPPALAQQFSLISNQGPQFAFDYGLSPTSASQLQFRSSQQNWTEAEDIDWSEVSSIVTTFGANGHIGFTLNQPDTQLYSATLRISGTGQWQGHTYINREAEEYTFDGEPDQTKIDMIRLADYKATLFNTSYSLNSTFKPFYYHRIWENSSLQYSLTGRLTKSEFEGTVESPAWKTKSGEWTKEEVSVHQMSANIAASLRDQVQSLVLTTELPPRDPTFGQNTTLRAWISETNIRNRILHPWDGEERTFEPVYFTETIKIGTVYPFQFRQDLIYDPELEKYTSLTSSLSWVGLTASFTAVRSRKYLLESTGWVQSTEEEKLNPREFQIGYAQTFKKEGIGKSKHSFSFNVNTKLTFDLQRYTYSRLDFSLGFTLGITNFLDLSFNTASQNTVVFRYIQKLPGFDLPVELPGEQNFFVDLANSFRFDDESLRRSSGFKLKTFTVSLTHHLGDWNAKLGISLSPYLDQKVQPYQYKFNNEISFIVQWIPINEIKTEISSNKDKLTIK